MKKITKLFSVLAVIAALFTLNSCEGLLPGIAPENNGNGGNGKSNGKTIEHEFYNSDTKGLNYAYFTDTQRFTCDYMVEKGFDKSTLCYYQIGFSFSGSNTKGTWTIYARPETSTNTLETIGKGTFKGNPLAAGTVELYKEDGTTLLQTLTVKYEKNYNTGKTIQDTYVFKADVTEVHTTIGATDAK